MLTFPRLKASIMGKLSYGYRKLTAKDPDNKPACAACDITHGGLHLDETAQWKAAKAEVVRSGAVADVKQFHRDELDGEVCASLQTFSFCLFPSSRGWSFGVEKKMDDGSLSRLLQTKTFVQSQGLHFPMVLAKGEGSGLRSVMSSEELATFKGDPQAFMQKLRQKLEGGGSAL